MDNQFAAPSALDDNERHYIGNLLSDDDAFSTAFKTEKEKVKTIHAPNANSNLPGPFQPIGPSPNGAFWPEPPPPYSAAVGVSTFCNTGKPFEVLQPLKPTMLASPYNNSFYPEKKNEPFASAWPVHNQSMFPDYYNSSIFDGLSFGAMEQTYETLGLNDSLTVKVDHETDSNVWSLSKDSSPLEQSPKTSHYDEEDRNANNLSPLSNQEVAVAKQAFSKLAEIETNLPTPDTCDNSAFCPPTLNTTVPKQTYSDVVINRTGEIKINPPIAAIQATQPKVWPKQNAREKKAAKAGSVDRTVNQRLQGSGNSNANSDFRKIIRKKGARAQPTPATPVTNSAASSNNHSPSKKRSESVATIEPLHADRHDISAGVVVHAPAIKMDSASRFEVLQSLPPSPTKKRTVIEKAEVKKEKEPTEKKASEDVTPAKNSERNKRRGIHHKLIGSVSQSRSASKKPIPVTAVGTTTASCTSTTKKTGSPQLSGGVIRVIFHIALALLTVAVEFVVHQISKLIFATVFFIQRGWNFAIETLHNLCIMTEQLLCNISAYTQHVLRRMLVTREERLALFLAKEPSPSLQDLDDHFFLECNETYSTNRPLPRDAESLLERLYKCFYADPYVVLGLTRKCTDEDIAQYYTAQAALVDPGKITMHACAQAYDLLTYAYAAIGTPNERESYDKWAYPSDDLAESTESNNFDKYSLWRTWCVFRSAMDQILRTLHCDCGINHICVLVSTKNPYQARFCRRCECLHAARQNDIWAESKWFGLHKRYYACLEGNIYDVSQWAACPCTRLKNLKPNNHNIHYRLQGTSGYASLFQKGAKAKTKSGQNRNTLSLYENDLIEELVNSEIAGDTVSVFPDRSVHERPRRAGRRRRFR